MTHSPEVTPCGSGVLNLKPFLGSGWTAPKSKVVESCTIYSSIRSDPGLPHRVAAGILLLPLKGDILEISSRSGGADDRANLDRGRQCREEGGELIGSAREGSQLGGAESDEAAVAQ